MANTDIWSRSGLEMSNAEGLRLDETRPAVKTSIAQTPQPTKSASLAATWIDSSFPLAGSDHRKRKDQQVPRPPRTAGWREFRTLCNEVIEELHKIGNFIQDGAVLPEALEVIVEVEHLLEKLYDCPWGQGESLKRFVLVLQSQLNNTEWSVKHVQFLDNAMRFLRVRYVVDAETVDEALRLVEEQGLDPFRGTVSDCCVLKKYRLQEVVD